MPLPPANPPEPSAPVPPLQPIAVATDAVPGSPAASAQLPAVQLVGAKLVRPAEVAGPAGLDPTRYGDWERAGRCIDF